MIADHPQSGRAACEVEYDTCISSGTKLEMILLQSADAKTAVSMRLTESVRQQAQRRIDLIQLISGERACLAFETSGNLNP